MIDVESQAATRSPMSLLGGSFLISADSANAVKLRTPPLHDGAVVLSDPATNLVTDFTREPPITVAENRLIDDALKDMKSAGVRSLIVTRGDRITGLITSYHIQGERPMQLLQSSGYTRHDQIEVGDIMTAWDRVPTLEWSFISGAQVRDVVNAFADSSATHVVIVEQDARGNKFARGMISRARIERQLGRVLWRP